MAQNVVWQLQALAATAIVGGNICIAGCIVVLTILHRSLVIIYRLFLPES